MINLFITGMLRSGTTLLEKALNTHPDIKILYQPFSELFIHTKQQFLRDKGFPPVYHALSHYCDESEYTPRDFTEWLRQTKLSREFIIRALPVSMQHLPDMHISPDLLLHQWYSLFVGQSSCPEGIRCLGTKEVLMEEYVPHMIDHGVFSVIIVRDPRDIITSLDFGSGSTYTGDHRPILFNLRNWRKSVYFALAASKADNFRIVKFEDLVLRPVTTLGKLSRMIGLSSFDEAWWADGLRNENNDIWEGNSSFGNRSPFNSGAIGGFKKNLTDRTRLYIEAVCRREMSVMGYDVSPSSISACKKEITGFRDPYRIERPEFHPDYSALPENIAFEIKHLENPEAASFLFPETAETMRCTSIKKSTPHAKQQI